MSLKSTNVRLDGTRTRRPLRLSLKGASPPTGAYELLANGGVFISAGSRRGDLIEIN